MNTSIKQQHEKATFAGGCFWCMVSPFQKSKGVLNVVSGYTGGDMENPTYSDVCTGKTGHYEAVQITFNPNLIGYRELLDIFWRQIDPTDPGGQFKDRGQAYQTVIFYHTDEQMRIAEESKKRLAESSRFDKPIVTAILPATVFYPAEDYHQDFHQKNNLRYTLYHKGSGREAFIKQHWPQDHAHLNDKLTAMQYYVTQENGTEPPFRNDYWDNTREGIYVDIVSGEPLFSSIDKFDSGCGWPSFVKPILSSNIEEKPDLSHGMTRTEVRSTQSDSHLGHVFDDGPGPKGLRYCINSAALRFIPKEDLEKEGYGGYAILFTQQTRP